VKTIGSAHSNLFSSISGGISALWGPLHGGANQEVIDMLTQIHRDGDNVAKYVEMAKKKENPFRLMGFGHRVYKNYDPRAAVIKREADIVLSKLKINDPLLDIAKRLEEVALSDPYFIEKKLYPNVDFYSGLIYKALGFPSNMFTVLFAIGRLPGWIAQWREMISAKDNKIHRPRQIYTGEKARLFIPKEERA
jgi:citrate synthase